MEKKSSFASTFFQNYTFSLVLLGSILLGSVLGIVFKEKAIILKPLGVVFLNLLFTLVVPLVFFSISSAMAGMHDGKRLGRILGWMMVIFIATGLIATIIMLVGVKLYPPAEGVTIAMTAPEPQQKLTVSEQIVRAFTVPDFMDLLSKRNMLALIVFSIIIGMAAGAVGEKGKPFVQFLNAGNAVMGRALRYIMLYAPIGLGAYFAALVGEFGPQLLGSYWRVVKLYYPLSLGYFFVAFTIYAFLAAGMPGIKRFWKNILPPSLTAWATGSSVATIPTNLASAQRIGVPEDIREVVIPIGATIHMEGSALAAMLKIAFLFGLYHMDFSGTEVIAKAVGVSILSGIVMSGIPGGGFLGELMIVTLYGFPIEALPILSMIGTLVDPPGTLVNAVGDNVSSMMVSRVLEGKNWLTKAGS
jgi:Na+/H+-dicarboxylate symporter